MNKLELAAAILKELRDYPAAVGSMPGSPVDVRDLVAWILMKEEPDEEKIYIVRADLNGKVYYLAPSPTFKTTDICTAKRLTKVEAYQYVSRANADVEGVRFTVACMEPPRQVAVPPAQFMPAPR